MGVPQAVKPAKPRKLIFTVSGRCLAAFIRLIRLTSRLRTEPEDLSTIYREPWPFIMGMWHGQFMMLPYANPDPQPVDIMLARHADAEVMGAMLESFGFDLIRGAGAGNRKRDRGGTEVLRAGLKALKNGRMVAMTCEVPPGPARRVTPGVITLAKLSGRPIRAVAAATSNYLTLNTWSRFTIGLPFSGYGIAFSEPIYVPRDASPQDMERYRKELEETLKATTNRAYELAGANIERSLPANVATVPQPGIVLKGYKTATRSA